MFFKILFVYIDLMKLKQESILFYDGDCGFCNSMVTLVLKNERDQTINFCALQSDKASELLLNAGKQTIDPETMYFKENGNVYERSDAALKVARHLRWYYRWLIIFRFVPLTWRNATYDFIAKRRKKIKKGFCLVPNEKQRDRFL